jgi:hypothetical protein
VIAIQDIKNYLTKWSGDQDRKWHNEGERKKMVDMMIKHASMTGTITPVNLPAGYSMPWSSDLKEYVRETPQKILDKLPEIEKVKPSSTSYNIQESLKALVRNGQAEMDKYGFVRKIIETKDGIPLQTVLGRIIKPKGGI